MAASTFSLDNFRSEILSSSGLARTNRFEVIINSPPALGANNDALRLVNLYVEQASLPLLNIFTKPFKIFGPTYQRPITSEYGGEGLPITFHVDRDMKIRKFFEDWMHSVVDPVTFTVNYQKEYVTTVDIKQLNDKNEVTHSIQLREAFPRNMNIMELNNASSNQTHRLTVLFAYRYWVDQEKTQTNPVAIPRPVAIPQVPRPDTNYNYKPATMAVDIMGNQTGFENPPGG